ncbi:MAG: ATP synthase F0 subunit A [Candidatus Marinimicrobia bacterium]|nr:ATP synthase F0 subunit A [Candidatus Neomarinimicrobiota bacterium]
MKFNVIIILLSSLLFSGASSESIDGEYIMDHIQDDRTFEIFNPLDYNDSNYGILTKQECYEIKKKYKSKYPKKKVVWHGSSKNPDVPAPCGDGYFFTKKVKLDSDWNQFLNIPIIGSIFNWRWNPSESLGLSENSQQLIITKQLIMMFIASSILIVLFVFGYKKNKKVQSGLGNLLEVFVLFIRDEVVYPNMGEKQGRKFLPLILTFFFFIVTLNLLGLIPGSATATASFSFTVGMALITFFTYIIFGNKDFWKHIFATPGVPLWLLPIMIPVELIGLLTKPFALSVRLLANMNAGHIIIAAFLGIIINMKSVGVAFGSVPMAIAINMLEIFVAFLQGYIFSLLSSIFIGMAVVEHEHH